MVKDTQFSARLDVLERRLAKMEKRNLIAGSNIRITDAGNGNLLIDADAQDSSTGIFQDRIADLESVIESIRFRSLLEDAGLTGNRCRRTEPQEDYSFLVDWEAKDYPFRVKLEGRPKGRGESTNILVCGKGTGDLEALVFAGVRDPIDVSQQRFSVSSPCYVLLTVSEVTNTTTSTVTLSAVLSVSGSIPYTSDQSFVVPIAQIEYSLGIAQVHQLHFGNVFVAGRVI